MASNAHDKTTKSSGLALSVMFLLMESGSVLGSTKESDVKTSRHFRENPVFNLTLLMGPRQEFEPIHNMPEETRWNRLTQLAKSHDANADDVIDQEELGAWVRESVGIIHHMEAENDWKNMDANEDGEVTVSEALLKMQITESEVEAVKGKANEGQSLSKDEKGLLLFVNAERRRFDVADLNKDGVLSKEESVYFLLTFNYPFMAEVELDIHMEVIDKNNDSFVTLEEFTSEVSDTQEIFELNLKFKGLDADNNDQLSREEMKVFILPDNERGVTQEVSKIFEEADENKDGVLTIDEIVREEASFLNGMPTNFGVHLNFVKDEL